MHAAVLRYFRETARLGSMRRAATALNVAASAINRQLLQLERTLGTTLFDRLPAGLRVTPAGEILLRHVLGTISDFERARAEIDALKGARTGHVTVVAVDSLLVDFLPRALESFRADYPAVTHAVHALPPADIPAEVVAGRADLGFTFVAQPPAGAAFIASIAAPIGVVMAAGHPLARRARVRFEDCRLFPVLLQHGPLPKSADIDREFGAFRESVAPRLVSNSIALVKHAVRHNMGISFYTRLGFLNELQSGEIVWRPLASRPINRLRLGLVVARGRAPSPAVAAMTERLTRALRAIEAPPPP